MKMNLNRLDKFLRNKRNELISENHRLQLREGDTYCCENEKSLNENLHAESENTDSKVQIKEPHHTIHILDNTETSSSINVSSSRNFENSYGIQSKSSLYLNDKASTVPNVAQEADDDAARVFAYLQGHSSKDHVIEEWVSDAFYSYFPSFNILDKKREKLAKARRRDYQEYLKKISDNQNTKRCHHKNSEVAPSDSFDNNIVFNKLERYLSDNISNNSKQSSIPVKLSLQNLKHTSLSMLVNANGIADRNKADIENEKRKKLEYQKQLLQQIEEKKKETQELKQRDQLEEELLDRKIKEQVKMMQLQDELQKEKNRAEKIHLNIEQNQNLLVNLLGTTNIDEKPVQKYNSAVFNKNNVYKYFSNYCRRRDYDKYSHENYFESSNSESEEFHPSKSTCRLSLERCGFGTEEYKGEKLVTYNGISPENKEQWVRNVCTYCGEAPYCRTPLTSYSVPTEGGRLRRLNKSFKIHDIMTYDDEKKSNCGIKNSFVQRLTPFATFDPQATLIESKLFGRSNNLSNDEKANVISIEENTNGRLNNYLKNYGDLDNRSSSCYHNNNNNPLIRDVSSVSMPLLNENN